MKAIALKSFGILALVLMSFSLMSLSDGSSRKFWGTELSWGACGPNSDGSPGCFQGQYSTYYVFWIATSDSEPTGVTQSCNCP